MAFTFQATAWNSATTPKATASMTWAAGDEVIAVGLSEGANVTLNTPTATGLTFSLVTSQTTGGTAECGAYLWRATAGAGGSGAISFTRGATSGFFGGAAWVRPGTASAVVALTGNVSEAAYNQAVSAGDDVIVAGGDWNATTPAKTPLTGSGTATERVDTGATNLGVWIADWQGTAAGTFDFGPNNFTGMRWAQVGIVMRAGAAGTNAPATVASGTGTAQQAAARVAPPPTVASSAATAAQASATVGPRAGVAASDGQAFNATVTTTHNAPATVATAAATAVQASARVAPPATAATATATASNATVTTASSTTATASTATTTATASPATTRVAPAAGAATASATAANAATATTTGTTTATAAATAYNATVATSSGGVTLLGTFARANADPHSITIPGATAGRDVYLVVNTGAVITTPSGWTSVTSRIVDMDSHIYVLPGASNPGGDLAVTLDLTAGRPLAAIALETAPADSGTTYASLIAPINAPGSTTWGTGAHTYTTRDTALAIYCLYSPGATGSVPTFGVTGFDQGFTLLGDTGWAGTGTSADEGSRIIIGQASNVGFTASGVVLTLDAAGPTGAALGFLAFDSAAVGAPTAGLAPATGTASDATTRVAATGATATSAAMAYSATVNTSAATNAPAGTASAAATAQGATTRAATGAQPATAAATAPFVAGSAAGLTLTAELPVTASASAYNATVSTAFSRNAPATVASAAAAAQPATARVSARPTTATASASAANATVTTTATGSATAGLASATATAFSATVRITTRAGTATSSATAQPATVSTAAIRNAPATVATVSAQAFGATVRITVTAQPATAAAQARNATTNVGALVLWAWLVSRGGTLREHDALLGGVHPTTVDVT